MTAHSTPIAQLQQVMQLPGFIGRHWEKTATSFALLPFLHPRVHGCPVQNQSILEEHPVQNLSETHKCFRYLQIKSA